MVRTKLTIFALLLASLASAQTQNAPVAATPAEAAPALVSTVAPQTGDSPLVQAAKRSVKARQKVTVKIDNLNVKSATKLLTTTDTARTIPVFPPRPVQKQPSTTPAAQAGVQKNAEKPKSPAERPPMDDAEGLYDDEEAPPTEQKAGKPNAPKPRP